jgi:hypothetical protein
LLATGSVRRFTHLIVAEKVNSARPSDFSTLQSYGQPEIAP